MLRTCSGAICSISTRNTYETHCCWSYNHTPNFGTICPAVPEIRKRGAHMRTCCCTPSSTCVKRLANWSLTMCQRSAQSVHPLPKYGKGAHMHVRTCRFTTSMTCAIGTTVWSLKTHQIWSQLAESVLGYGLVANFDTLHAIRATCQGGLQMSQIQFQETFIE